MLCSEVGQILREEEVQPLNTHRYIVFFLQKIRTYLRT